MLSGNKKKIFFPEFSSTRWRNVQTKVIWLRVEEWGEVGWEGIKKGENCSPLATSKWGGGGQGVGEPGRMGGVRVQKAGEERVGSNQGE